MIPEKKFKHFNDFYFRTIYSYRSKYFIQNRNTDKRIDVNLKAAKGGKGFGWLEITPLSFSEIYVNAIKSQVNRQEHLFILHSTKELIDLFDMLFHDPNAELPEALEYEEEIKEELEYEVEEEEIEYEVEEELEYEVEEEMEYEVEVEVEEEEELEYEDENETSKKQVKVSIIKDNNKDIEELEEEFSNIVRKEKEKEEEQERRFLF